MKRNSILWAVCLLAALTACGGTAGQTPPQPPAPAPSAPEPAAPTPEPAGPAGVQEVSVTCHNQGEEAQYVTLTFSLDGPVEEVLPEDFTAVLSGEELAPEALAVETGETSVALTLQISALKFGQLDLTYAGDGMAPFTCRGVVTPGLELKTISQDPQAGTAEAQVLHAWDVRGAVRLQLWENGALLPAQGEESSETTAVHGHDFLNIDCTAAAASIAAALSESYPDGYRFTSEGDVVILEKLEPDGETLLELTALEGLTLRPTA